jgi:hypothetical protein
MELWRQACWCHTTRQQQQQQQQLVVRLFDGDKNSYIQQKSNLLIIMRERSVRLDPP